MKKLMVLLSVFVLLLGLVVGTGYATTFGDNSIFFPGFANSSAQDGQDVIGSPDFTGGSINVAGGNTVIRFDYTNTGGAGNLWGLMTPSGLFIDNNLDQVWDVYIDSFNNTAGGQVNVYSVNVAYGAAANFNQYILSNAAWFPNPGTPRSNHAVALQASELTNNIGSLAAAFLGWNTTLGSGSSDFTTFTVASNLLGLGSQFAIGFTTNCANDVIYEPVPIPGAVWLLGSGLLGLLGFRRKFVG